MKANIASLFIVTICAASSMAFATTPRGTNQGKCTGDDYLGSVCEVQPGWFIARMTGVTIPGSVQADNPLFWIPDALYGNSPVQVNPQIGSSDPCQDATASATSAALVRCNETYPAYNCQVVGEPILERPWATQCVATVKVYAGR